MKRIIYFTIALLLSTLLLWYFYSKQNVNDRKVIGVICDQTGLIAEYGNWVRKGTEIALESINKTDHEFEILFEDGQTNPQKALNALEKLKSIEKIELIVVGCNSSSIMSMAPKIDSTKNLLLSTVASSPNMKTAGENVFSNRVLGIQEVESIVKNLQTLDIKSIAIVAHNNEAGMPYILAFKEASKYYNAKIVSQVLLDPNSNDFHTEIIKLKALQPDAVLLVTPSEQSINFIKQAGSVQFSPKWLGISSMKTDDFIKNGGILVNGMILASESIDESSKEYIEFRNKYIEKYKESPTIYSANGYDAIMVLYQLIKKYGNNITDIKKALKTEQFKTLSGTISFDSDGMIINKKVDLFTIRNNRFVNITE